MVGIAVNSLANFASSLSLILLLPMLAADWPGWHAGQLQGVALHVQERQPWNDWKSSDGHFGEQLFPSTSCSTL